MYIVPGLLEEIFLRLPLKSILKFKTVSKQWRSILESRSFVEKRTSLLHKNRKILAAYDCDCGGRLSLIPESRFEGDEEIVSLHCNATRLSLTCDGLVCFPEEDWIVVLNPSTRQLRRFPSGLNLHHKSRFRFGLWWRFTPGNWAMGFGRDKVTWKYKVVRMCFSYREIGQQEPMVECGVLDVQAGEWRILNPPPHVVNVGSKSVCVKGSIYWLHIERVHTETGYKILALDLHKEEFRDVSVPATWVTLETQIVNLEDRLAIAKTKDGPEWILEIWSMDTEEERWSKTYSISLAHRVISRVRLRRWFTSVAVSKHGNLVFCDNQKRLFKYYPRRDEIHCLSLDTCVISPYMENLVSLPLKPSHPHPYPPYVNSDSKTKVFRCRLLSREPSSWLSKVLQRDDKILEILFTSLVIFGYFWSPSL